MSQVYLVTGANSGLGLDTVRQLAVMSSTRKIYLACRSKTKAETAMAYLKREHSIDTTKLAYAHFDASQPQEAIVQSMKDLVQEPLTGLVLNAGGIGHDTSSKPTGPNHVLDVYQINLIGHVQLVEALKAHNLLAPGCKIVYSGSEGARGVPMMMIANPKLGATPQWYKQTMEGNASSKKNKKVDPMATYAMAKGMAALYFAEWARRNPEYTVWVVSPGGTSGTEAMSAKAVPGHFKVMLPAMMPLMSAMGVMHPVHLGAQRYVNALTQKDYGFASGTFVASKRGTTGKVADQVKVYKRAQQYADVVKQKAAFEALSSFVQAA